jgi:hypothetical protein
MASYTPVAEASHLINIVVGGSPAALRCWLAVAST